MKMTAAVMVEQGLPGPFTESNCGMSDAAALGS